MQNENNKELIPLFPSVKNNKVFELVELNTVLNGIKSGNYNLNNIIFSRKQSNKLDYQTKKEQSKQTYWGFNPTSKKFNGLVYLDFDLQPGDNLEFTKKLINDLSFIKATWQSYGGKGVGALAYCSWIKTADDYKLAYKSLEIYILNKIGLQIDNKCSHHHRYNTISFDQNILIKDNYTSFNEIIHVKSKCLDYLDEIKFDDSIKLDYELFSNFMDKLNNDYYFSSVITDKQDRPILFSKDLKFDESIHNIKKYFTPEIISTYEIKNESNTMAFSYKDFACAKLNIQSKQYYAHGTRSKTLTSIVINLLIISQIEKSKFSKSIIYTYLVCLNSKCVKSAPKSKDEMPVLLPLDNDELNKLSSYIYNHFINKTAVLNIKTCKSIRTDDFKDKFLIDNPDYLGDKHIRTLILKEINNLKRGKIKINHRVRLTELIERYPGLTNEEYIEAYSIEQEISLSYSKELFYNFKKVSSEYAHVLYNNIYNTQAYQNDTFFKNIPNKETLSSDKHTPNDTKIQNAINDTYFTNKKITQNEIMERTGLSIITIKRYWSKYKDQVKLHNNSIIK